MLWYGNYDTYGIRVGSNSEKTETYGFKFSILAGTAGSVPV